MSLFINQGKQDTTQDNKFEVLVAKDVLAQIVGIKLANTENTLEISFKILSGAHKNRLFWDRIQYLATKDFDQTWKYRELRKAAGCPYKEGDSVKIDIEPLLLNKAVLCDLGSRKGKNKQGEETEYQNVKYKVAKNDQSTDAITGDGQEEVPDDNELPFNIPEAEEPVDEVAALNPVINDAEDW